MSDAWDDTQQKTSTGRPIDGILCPVSSLAGYPHDFLPWWGYTCLFNLVDYPSTVLPVKSVKINATDDPKDTTYVPQDNPFDKDNHEICKLCGLIHLTYDCLTKSITIDDPNLWSNQPVAIQIVARPFDDEELVAATEVVDRIVNGTL